MKLKNFIKKQKTKKAKETKTFHTTLKPVKKQNRAKEKAHHKFSKRTFFLIRAGIVIFIIVILLFIVAFLYNNYISGQINSKDIITPGRQNVIELDPARQLIIDNDIKIESFGYGSGSSILKLKIEEGATVYFSNSIKFSEQIELLKKILYSLKTEDKKALVIDLRYNRPIVKF